jgi:gas vesicle protein
MSETLLGVLIGGCIGSIAPLATLLFNHLHWKREAKLAHLKAERTRLEQLFDKTLDTLSEAMKNNAYPSKMSADINILMSEEISDLYNKFMAGGNETTERCKMAYIDIAHAMKSELAKVDKKINDCISNAIT